MDGAAAERAAGARSEGRGAHAGAHSHPPRAPTTPPQGSRGGDAAHSTPSDLSSLTRRGVKQRSRSMWNPRGPRACSSSDRVK